MTHLPDTPSEIQQSSLLKKFFYWTKIGQKSHQNGKNFCENEVENFTKSI